MKKKAQKPSELPEEDPFIMRVEKMIGALPEEELPPGDPFRTYDISSIATPPEASDPREHTGGSVSYYVVDVASPTTPGRKPYTAECNDIIEALGMSFAEGNAFKAIWRACAARQGRSKRGYDDEVYDAEKVVFFGKRMIEMAKRRS